MARKDSTPGPGHNTDRKCPICAEFWRAVFELAHHTYCLGGATHNEVVAAMAECCDHAKETLLTQLTADTALPHRR